LRSARSALDDDSDQEVFVRLHLVALPILLLAAADAATAAEPGLAALPCKLRTPDQGVDLRIVAPSKLVVTRESDGSVLLYVERQVAPKFVSATFTSESLPKVLFVIPQQGVPHLEKNISIALSSWDTYASPGAPAPFDIMGKILHLTQPDGSRLDLTTTLYAPLEESLPTTFNLTFDQPRTPPKGDPESEEWQRAAMEASLDHPGTTIELLSKADVESLARAIGR
jgi:hypothetical protein